MRMKVKKKIWIIAISMMAIVNVQGQCPELYDFFGTPNANPYWYSCTGTDYTLIIQSPDNIGTWTIDWGDGSPTDSGADLIPPANITHLYPATVDSFIVVFTETSSGCVTQGVLVMEEATSASIQIPTCLCYCQTIIYIHNLRHFDVNSKAYLCKRCNEV